MKSTNQHSNMQGIGIMSGGSRERGYRHGYLSGVRDALRAQNAGLTPADAEYWLIALERWRTDHMKKKPVEFCPPEPFAAAAFERKRERVVASIESLSRGGGR